MLPILPDEIRPQGEIIEESQPEKWIEIDIQDDWSLSAQCMAVRLNALARLFYFSFTVLGHTRLSPNLHGYMASTLEREHLRLVMEIPRGHFKTTISTISGSMWWALPFLDEDEQAMRELGYSDAWIRWMKVAHDTCCRTLICSEVGKNVKDLGDKVDWHYQKNDVFRLVFPEIIPKTFSKNWNESSKTQVRIGSSGFHGEGTYDFIGAGSALQSRHYKKIIEDDLVGENAIASQTIMEGTIEWHQRLPGLFDSIPGQPDELGDQLVIGNRWSKRDLNQAIRDQNTMQEWEFLTHSAEGGCCDLHPDNTPIFPEEFSMKKLAQIKREEKAYNYSCHYLNNPVAKDAVRFDTNWLRYYKTDVWENSKLTRKNVANWSQLSHENKLLNWDEIDKDKRDDPKRLRMGLTHEVRDGEAIEDIRAGELDRVAILDPNHAGENGRSRNAIVILGVWNRPRQLRRLYLLEVWAKACHHDEWILKAVGTQENNRGLCLKWKVQYLYIESNAGGQKGWEHFFKEKVDQLYQKNDHCFSVRPLNTGRNENETHRRIIGMEPIYEQGYLWVPRHGSGVALFMEEYGDYPNGKYSDILSTMGYAPQTWTQGSKAGTNEFIEEQNKQRKVLVMGIGNAGY